MEITGELAGASTYVAKKNGEPVSIILYRLEQDALVVISDYAVFEENEILCFAEYMFQRYGSVRLISFRKLQKKIAALPYPLHAVACTEDMILTLPATVKEYHAAVGKNMRRNIKRYTNALAAQFPGYRYELLESEEIDERQIRDLIALSCMRMQSKKIVPRFNETETRWIIDFARKCGILGLATIDGRVCAGAIGFRMGDDYFMHVIAHDPQYNGYSLGIVCYFHTICEGIARGGKRFHLLQGRYGYKYRLLAERNDIFHVDIYRSRLYALTHSRRIFMKELKGRIWLIKQWLLHDVERHEGKLYRLLGKAVHALRSRKRSRGGMEM